MTFSHRLSNPTHNDPFRCRQQCGARYPQFNGRDQNVTTGGQLVAKTGDSTHFCTGPSALYD